MKMKHYSHINLLLAICILIWPLQSCANNSAPKSSSENSEYYDSFQKEEIEESLREL